MNKQEQEQSDEILEALWTRECCKGNAMYNVSKEEATDHHMGMVEDAKTERELLVKGNQYFEQGYRLHQSHRQMSGGTFGIPVGAIAYRIVSAGYRATYEMSRFQHVTKR